jgi:hypothetical protein
MVNKLRKIISNFEGTHQQLREMLRGKPSEPTNPTEDLSALKVIELKAIAKQRGLKGYSALNKAALIEKLKE